jgi:hypothetical protein
MPTASQSISPVPSSGGDDVVEWQLQTANRADEGVGRFRFALVFLIIYFIRPQDWVVGLQGFNIIRLLMVCWIALVIMNGARTTWKEWIQTPQDWAIAAFYAYVVWNAPSEAKAGSGMFALVAFYFLTVNALDRWDKLFGYLKVWNACLLVVASFGVLQHLGLDITNGKEYTEYSFGRLAIGTSLANNPNALGHTVVVAIPLSYVLYFWRGSSVGRFIIFPICAGLAGWCAFLTESKGSFLVGGLLCMLAFVVGRPSWVKISVLIVALTTGAGALSTLPRMEKMSDLSSDHGVQGRLLAWEQAKTTMELNSTGVGWRQFMALIDWQEGDYWHFGIPKATHSSYVQVGADLGRYGLFIWLLVLVVALKATWVFKAQNDTEERVRRSILLMLTAYMISGWMINREYHTEYYLLVAIAAAMHRLNASRAQIKIEDSPVDQQTLRLPWAPLPSWETALSDALPEEQKSVPQIKTLWNRINWVDLAVAFAATWAVIEFWDYILKNL